jgi:hypothetical protein
MAAGVPFDQYFSADKIKQLGWNAYKEGAVRGAKDMAQQMVLNEFSRGKQNKFSPFIINQYLYL